MTTHDPIQNSVIERIKNRAEYGRAKYSDDTMMANTSYNGRRWLQEMQDEALDLAAYVERVKLLFQPTVEDMVKEFNTAFKDEPKGSFDSPKVMEFFLSRIQDEYKELLDAAIKGDKENFLKEACDLIYITVGCLVSMGMPFDLAFARVHESNMSKLVNGRYQKGSNYKPADLKDLI